MSADTKTDGFRGVPGIPDGWELVGFRKLMKGDWSIDLKGSAWLVDKDSYQVWPVIRKIEKPKQYRTPTNADIGKPCEVYDGSGGWKPATYCGYTASISLGGYHILWPNEKQVDFTGTLVRIEVTDE